MRYSRQIPIKGFNQDKLSKAKVAVIGAGGLGSSVLYQLAAAGVGELHIFDFDIVSESNLNRQILHFTRDIGRKKVISAAEKLSQLNPLIHIIPHDIRIDKDTVNSIEKPDIIIDALDNFEARFIINRYAVRNRIPLIHGAVEGFYGRLTTIIPFKTPCLRCIYNNSTSSESPAVLVTTAMVTGTLQADEAIKLITGIGNLLIGKLLMIDLRYNEFSCIGIEKQENCPICGRNS